MVDAILTTTCRTCCRPVAWPYVRRDVKSGDILEVCVAVDHDGLVRDADVAFERDARCTRFDRKGLSRS